MKCFQGDPIDDLLGKFAWLKIFSGVQQIAISFVFVILTGALLGTLFTGILLLSLIEPQSFLALSFEATSAIGTVGLSMGITQVLTKAG